MRKEELLKSINKNKLPNHLAIILDGNGRWATKRALPRKFGHKKGIANLMKIAKFANSLGIKNLTVFAFSTENWSRPMEEVDYLMDELEKFYRENNIVFSSEGIRVKIIGERSNLSPRLIDAITQVENATIDNPNMTLNVAFNYGSFSEITSVIKKMIADGLSPDDVNQDLLLKYLYTSHSGLVDLLIRTSGEIRISNFLLMQIAYSELYFTKVLWPDFNESELLNAIIDYQKRKRTYGGLK